MRRCDTPLNFFHKILRVFRIEKKRESLERIKITPLLLCAALFVVAKLRKPAARDTN